MRKARTLFPDERQAELIIDLLDEYGRGPHEREPDRVRLAILKLSGADPDRLLHHVLVAKSDYRDVLAWAEYPAGMNLNPGAVARDDRRARAADAAQYCAWLAE